MASEREPQGFRVLEIYGCLARLVLNNTVMFESLFEEI